MKPVIKIDLDNIYKSTEPVIIELGCGPSKKPVRIGIDHIDLPNVDIVADMENGLKYKHSKRRSALSLRPTHQLPRLWHFRPCQTCAG